MNSPEKRNMDRYYKDLIDSKLEHELKILDRIIMAMVNMLAHKHALQCKTADDFYGVLFDHWECFSEVMPPCREVKWNLMNISKCRDICEIKGYGKDKLDNEEMRTREKCLSSMLWFGDVLAYSAGLIKEDLRARRLFGFDD